MTNGAQGAHRSQASQGRGLLRVDVHASERSRMKSHVVGVMKLSQTRGVLRIESEIKDGGVLYHRRALWSLTSSRFRSKARESDR
jgi:hypothetical protein